MLVFMETMNRVKTSQLIKIINILLILSLLLAGCSGSNAAASGKTYRVAKNLQEFYDKLGGEGLLGPAISKIFDGSSGQCQYTANVLMCENSILTGDARFSLAPLGTGLNLREEPAGSTSEANLVVNGYTVYEEFVPLYRQLSEGIYAGDPISQVHLNYEKQRIEQFFTNVGFYRNFSDPRGTIKLIAYGVESCVDVCKYRAASEAALFDGAQLVADGSLLDELETDFDKSVFGKPLTQLYQAADGNQEQVFEGIVLYRDIFNGVVRLRPLAVQLGMQTSEPRERVYGSESGVVFYAVQDNLGYHVPVLFDEFISTHGGSAISGDPIADVIEYEPGLFRQCFTNFCLDYAPNERKNKQLLVAPLGSKYMELEPGTPIVAEPSAAPATPIYTLQVSELHNPLAAEEAQQINIVLLNAADQLPLPGIETDLTLNLPDGTTYQATLPATLTDGSSSIVLPVMKKIPNGTIMTYQVCISTAVVEPVCQSGSFLVWTVP